MGELARSVRLVEAEVGREESQNRAGIDGWGKQTTRPTRAFRGEQQA